MKTVAFDARMASHPGIGRYIRSLLREMIISGRYHFRLIGDPEVLSVFADHAEVIPCHHKIYGLKSMLTSSALYDGADIIHIPHFNVPFNLKVPFVATIHDLIHFEFGEYKPFPGALILLKHQLRRVFKKSAAVIAVSQSTRQSCVRMFNASESKIRVIYEAAEEGLAVSQGRPEGLEACKYLLCVGSVREHKNIHGILSAYEFIRHDHPEIKLVVLGKLDSRFESKHGFLKRLSDNPGIIHVGNADDRQLMKYYQHAECLIAASFVEGFGLPVIEAMMCGTPCAVSKDTSLAEVAGDAALTFDPYDSRNIADTVLRILSDSDLNSRLRKSGIQRAAQFSWKKCADETLALYDKVLGK